MMQSYTETIMVATGCTEGRATVLEQIVRAEHPTLDHLTRRELTLAARDADTEYSYFLRHDPEVAALYEKQAWGAGEVAA